MKLTPLKWQKFWGFIVPMLLGWILIYLLMYLTLVSVFGEIEWLFIVLAAVWLSLAPMLGYLMGIVSGYFWRNQNWNEQTYSQKGFNLLIYFWLFLPLTYGLIYSVVGIVVFPLHGLCFFKGQELGHKWAETDMINQFLGRSNEWERNELE